MHSLLGKDFITMKGVERADLELIFDVTREMEQTLRARTRTDLLKDKLLGLMFFQVSTRTRISFESAMQRLGGGVVGFVDPASTRIGDYYAESLHDVVRMMEHYSDVIVIRHPKDFAPAEAAAITDVPVINAGDGYNEHPTQALLDLYTILRERGSLEGAKVGIVGDLKVRVFHSLPLGLAQYHAKAYFVSPKEAGMPEPWLEEFRKVGLDYEVANSVDEVIEKVDAIYIVGATPPSFHVGRSEAKPDRAPVPKPFTLDREKVARAKPEMIILHPLPRTDELPTDLDAHATARYFVQAYYGVAVRMALLSLIFGRAP